MRFLLHSPFTPDVLAAMTRHDHICHQPSELTDEPADLHSPAWLAVHLQQKQWNLLTTDSSLVNLLYETKVQYSGIIILLLDAPALHAAAIDRLFERYPRLTARRLYTVTASRVKIRQLPGAAGAA